MFYVKSISGFAAVQDLGRKGYRHLGVSCGGAMDTLALRAGNLALGNCENAPAIELAMGALELTFDCVTPFVLSGAAVEAFLDDRPISTWGRYVAHARQVLRITRFVQGNYLYICFCGGVRVPSVLGACATDTRAGFGGFYGRLLRTGDVLTPDCAGDFFLPELGFEPVVYGNLLRALPSVEAEFFSEKVREIFFSRAWHLLPSSSRMGFRLQGEALLLERPLEMLSHAVSFGTVQVPPEGQPIVLMAEAQTTGGYPRMAQVIASDLGVLAQVPLGSYVRFQRCDFDEAHRAYLHDEAYLARLRALV